MWHNDFMLTATIARELTLDAAQSARNSRGAGALKTLPPQQIKKLLDSRHDREVLEGLRKVISVCLPDFLRLPASLLRSGILGLKVAR